MTVQQWLANRSAVPATATTTQVPLNQMPGLPGVTGTSPYGYIPVVPDLTSSQAAVNAANLANWGGIEELLKKFSQGTTAAAQEPYNLALPGWQGAMTTGLGNAMDFMQGQIPSSDLVNLTTNALSNRFARGIQPGSPASNAALVQQILGGELALNQRGTQDFATLMGLVPKGAQLDPSQMMLTPEQYQNWAWLSSVMRASPDPTLARQAELAAIGAGLNSYNPWSGGGYGGGYGGSQADQMAASYLASKGNVKSPFTGGSFPTMTTTAPGSSMWNDQWSYSTPEGTSLEWTGLDMSDWFDNPYETTPSEEDWIADSVYNPVDFYDYYGYDTPQEDYYSSDYSEEYPDWNW